MANRSLIHQMEARERRGRWFPALAGLLSIALLGSTWVGLFTFLGANSAYGTVDKIRAEYVPDVESLSLSLPDLSRVSRVYAKNGELLAELHDGRNSEPVAIEQVPELVRLSMLAAEDKNFYDHHGVSFPAIASAALDNFRSGSSRGGSTITQQIVKNVFVGDEVTIERKIKEAFIAAELERRYTKDEILEFYMNSVYFGVGRLRRQHRRRGVLRQGHGSADGRRGGDDRRARSQSDLLRPPATPGQRARSPQRRDRRDAGRGMDHGRPGRASQGPTARGDRASSSGPARPSTSMPKCCASYSTRPIRSSTFSARPAKSEQSPFSDAPPTTPPAPAVAASSSRRRSICACKMPPTNCSFAGCRSIPMTRTSISARESSQPPRSNS